MLFDERADRWLLAELSASTNALCLYVSLTGDPVAGGWCGYQIDTAGALEFPQIGIWSDAYVLTGDEAVDLPVYALDRDNMVVCGTARATQRRSAPRLAGFGFQALTPADADGPVAPAPDTPAVLARHRDDELHTPGTANPDQDALELWQLTIDWTTPAATALNGPTALPLAEIDSALCPPLSSRACIPQPGTGVLLDPQVALVMPRLQYRHFGTHETLVGVLQTDVGDFADHTGERWLVLRRTGGGWSVLDEGTFAPDAEHCFMGSVAMDGDANLLLAYDVSSSSVFPSLRATGRQAEDPPGTMTSPETTLATGGGSSPSNQYGGRSQVDRSRRRLYVLAHRHVQPIRELRDPDRDPALCRLRSGIALRRRLRDRQHLTLERRAALESSPQKEAASGGWQSPGGRNGEEEALPRLYARVGKKIRGPRCFFQRDVSTTTTRRSSHAFSLCLALVCALPLHRRPARRFATDER
ncbi:MAG: hypothetical protein HC897_09950, partial [Thermoanaerobaculia bacterium]|nr:hypothetical protein [Thermoanaerobaculia bacterium]